MTEIKQIKKVKKDLKKVANLFLIKICALLLSSLITMLIWNDVLVKFFDLLNVSYTEMLLIHVFTNNLLGLKRRFKKI